MDNIEEKNLKKKIILKNKNFEIFCKNYPPRGHIKYKVIIFAPINKSIMANEPPSTSLERFLRRIKSPLTC